VQQCLRIGARLSIRFTARTLRFVNSLNSLRRASGTGIAGMLHRTSGWSISMSEQMRNALYLAAIAALLIATMLPGVA
jgi:hypothetical protein